MVLIHSCSHYVSHGLMFAQLWLPLTADKHVLAMSAPVWVTLIIYQLQSPATNILCFILKNKFALSLFYPQMLQTQNELEKITEAIKMFKIVAEAADN